MMPDQFPLLVPRALAIGQQLHDNKDNSERLLGELGRLEKQALEAARQARIILDNNKDGNSDGS